MRSKLVPPTIFERFTAIAGLIFAVIGVGQLAYADYAGAAASGIAVVLSIINAYVLQTQPSSASETTEYSKVLNQVASIGLQLTELGKFLERERSRVAATEETIKQLNEERARLEPVVQAQRTSVEAILAAHAKRTARNAWKERFFGLFLGVAASIIASYLYELLNH